jgi:putative membrane fusion protein
LKKSKKIISIILVLIIAIYVGYAIYLLIVDPTDTYIIKEGTLSQEDTVTGYIIRDEVVIKGENSENGIFAVASEGERVAKSDYIFRYYSDSEKEINTKISELNYKIQELLEQEENESSADIKAIDNQIEDQIKDISNLTNYQEITEYKNSIDSLFSKKIKFIGEITENAEIKKLVQEKNSYEDKLKNGTEYQTAPISGIVSYRVDGLEEEFSINNFDNMTEEYLEKTDLKTGQIIASSNECGKVIDNFKCYIAATMDSEEAMNSKVGDSVQIRTSNKEEIKAEIVQINEENEKRTIILNNMTEDLINHRKIAVDIIWWNETGLKVPNQALIEENGLYYVIKNKAGIQTKILVKLECQTDKFSIISTYSAKDLQEIGYDQEEIKNYKKINNYDEIMLQSQK